MAPTTAGQGRRSAGPLGHGDRGTDVHDVLVARRSVRTYTREPVPDDLVLRLLDAARHAPSSLDGQPWHFVVVRSAETKCQLAAIKNRYCPPDKRAYPADFLAAAPVVIAVCVEHARAFGRHVEDGVLAAHTIMIAAAARGLATVYLSATATDDPGLAADIRTLLAIPDTFVPVSIIPLGYPAAAPPPKLLRRLTDIVHYDRFRDSPA